MMRGHRLCRLHQPGLRSVRETLDGVEVMPTTLTGSGLGCTPAGAPVGAIRVSRGGAGTPKVVPARP